MHLIEINLALCHHQHRHRKPNRRFILRLLLRSANFHPKLPHNQELFKSLPYFPFDVSQATRVEQYVPAAVVVASDIELQSSGRSTLDVHTHRYARL